MSDSSQSSKEKQNEMARTLGLGKGEGRDRRRIIITAAAAAAALVVIVMLLRGLSGDSSAIRYITEEATRGPLIVTVVATGTLKSVNQVDVGSEISGTIRTLEADFNDEVKKGQVLATLDTDRLKAAVRQSEAALLAAKAGVLEARATLFEATQTYERYAQLWKESGGTSPSRRDVESSEATFKRAGAALESAKARVAEAEAVLDSNRTNIEKAVIRSPIDGVVLNRNVEPGQTVAASLQAPVLFTLAEDLRRMELHVDVDEAEVGLIKEGQEATFTVDAYPDRTFSATITMIRLGSKTLEGVVTYETVLSVDNSDVSLRPGMTATAEITVKKVEDALLVPNAALRFSPPEKTNNGGNEKRSFISRMFPRPRHTRNQRQGGESAKSGRNLVWTLRGGQPAAIEVSIGPSDGRMTEVLKGEVEPGMPLVVDMEESRK